jgi:hypothetical protein
MIVFKMVFRRISVVLVVFVISVVFACSASAACASSWWLLSSGSRPSDLPLGGVGQVVVTAENLGYTDADGAAEPIVVEDALPGGLRVRRNSKGKPEVLGMAGAFGGAGLLACSSPSPQEVRCTLEHALVPYEAIEVLIGVAVEPEAASTEENTVSVTGGGAVPKGIARPIAVGGVTGFGVEDYEVIPEEEGGRSSTQAGVHPFQLTSVLTFDTSELAPAEFEQMPGGFVKDLNFQLPPGLIGNPTPFAQCTDAQFNTQGKEGNENECGPQTAIGVVNVTLNIPGVGGLATHYVPLFNLTPLAGEPARFGFDASGFTTTLDVSVRTGSDYGVTVHVNNITQTAGVLSSKATFWGVPGDPRHDGQRGWACLEHRSTCGTLEEAEPPPFLSLPTSCSGPMRTTVQADSWAEPLPPEPFEPGLFEEYEIGGLDGCNRLQFNPEISVAPDVPDASSATGLTVDVHVPQTAALNPEGLAESTLRNTTVTLPAGVAINPSGADGLEACSEGLVGYLPGESTPPEELRFTPSKPGSVGSEGSEATLRPGVNFCPNASKIGTVKITTPLLPNPVQGAVYLADQNANPFGSLIAMYAVAEDPVSGTLVKLPFDVSLDPGTGRLVATSDNSPELPFETAEFHFFGGERAPLATPARCGAYTTQAALTPWSAAEGEPPHTASSTFDITSGPNGNSPCPGASLPFSPRLTGGATNLNAGAFSPFTLTMSRSDGEQNLQSVEAKLPPGLSGVLSNVELCPEPQANEGECGPNSLIGETTVSVGVGGHPFSVSGGKFYLTGPYNGSGGCKVGEAGCAPFGLTFEVPAKAGPFDLERNTQNPAGEDACDCVLVRGKIEINPLTAALTITSNPPGTPDAIPTSIEGIPLEIQHVNAITTRGDFQFNPTNCNKMEVTGTIHSSEHGTDQIGVPFQVTNCGDLKFTPKFKVSTSAHTSKADGASLTTSVIEPVGSLGTQANLTKVKVELPKQLPSRLTTLQKACTDKQFEANPAACPPESKVGYAKVITPLVPVPLEGPAIFVSHGGEAFPSLTMVLQGYGITIDLVGTTFISKASVTSTTFKTVPDQPFSSFQLTLPTGKYSALTALGNLCKEKLSIPTEFIAQNGAELKQSTKIGVTGCPKIKKLTRAQKLAAALKACRKKAKGHKRTVCVARARKLYAPLRKAKKGGAFKKK